MTEPAGASLGLHHLSLTVTDVEASARWYADVLGFKQVGGFVSPGGERRKILLRHRGLPVRLGLVEHDSKACSDPIRCPAFTAASG